MKKALILCLALAIALGSAITGTVAYLQDTDEDVNVYTVGNVEIDQFEMRRENPSVHTGTLKDGDLVEFEQYQNLYPAFPVNDKASDYTAEPENLLYWGPYVTAEGAGNGFWNPEKLKGAMDKIVFVKNTGDSPCYYRTWIAFECPEGMEYSQGADKEFMMNVNSRFIWDNLGYTTITDKDTNKPVRYLVMTATYKDALAAGEISRPSLLQVVMTHNATNEDVAKLDGSYEILAFTQAVQIENMPDAVTALNRAFWEPGAVDANNNLKTPWDSEGYTKPEKPTGFDAWDGPTDTSWYNDTDTEFEIETAEQLDGLRKLVDDGKTFEGKTVKLGADIDLYAVGENGERVSFNPIGYGYDIVFKGTFDGQGHTIKNLYQNGWDMGYSYSTVAGGLFASVVDATFKDLTLDNAEVVMECIDMGTLVGYSYGNCTYENITVKNSSLSNYQRYTGGVVGEVNGNHTFKNVDVLNTILTGLWGDFDCSLGGIIGGKYGDATIVMEDCDVDCQIDAFNDVTSSYQWYAYRRAGMLIGNSEETTKIGDRTEASASYLTARNCSVTYRDWANYTYCAFAGTSWPYVRVQASQNSSAYYNPRYGNPTDAVGNKVVDDNHVHNEGEDHQIPLTFDQLYGGGQGVYGGTTHEGVKIIYNNK